MGSCASTGTDACLTGYYQHAKTVSGTFCIHNERLVVRRTPSGSYQSINNYVVLKLLGEGRYGEVYACRSITKQPSKGSPRFFGRRESDQPSLGKELEGELFAVKVIRRKSTSLKECKILTAIRHPHIVSLLEYIDDPTSPFVFLVFENLGGGAIASCSNEGYLESTERWSEEKAAPLFLQMIEALSYLHSMGVYHRDIKPENVVFTETFTEVKLIDFGESRMIKGKGLGDDSSRITKGTPFFMAAEMLCGKHFQDKEADVWALGVLFFLLLVGHVPFGAGHTQIVHLYDCIGRDTPRFPSGTTLSSNVRHMLLAMLERDTSKRATLPYLKCHPFISGTGKLQSGSEREESEAPGTPTVQMSSSTHHSLANSTPLQSASSLALNPLQSQTRLCSPGLKALQIDIGELEDNITDNSRDDIMMCITPTKLSERALRASSVLGNMVGKEVRVLICDDCRAVRAQFISLMQNAQVSSTDVRYYEAIAGEVALRKVLDEARDGRPFDLVIMDVYPYSDVLGLSTTGVHMTGVDVVRAMRRAEEQEQLVETPVLISTTQEEQPHWLQEAAEELGSQVIFKPISPAQVYNLLAQLGIRYQELNDDEVLACVRKDNVAEQQALDNAIDSSRREDLASSVISKSSTFVRIGMSNGLCGDPPATDGEPSPFNSAFSPVSFRSSKGTAGLSGSLGSSPAKVSPSQSHASSGLGRSISEPQTSRASFSAKSRGKLRKRSAGQLWDKSSEDNVSSDWGLPAQPS